MAVEEKGSNDFQTVIRILQEKRALVDAALQSAIAASGAFFPAGEGNISSLAAPSAGDSQLVELPRGAFLNKSLPAAVKLYLSSVVKKQSIKEIASALREGGVVSTSDNFEGVITGCLHRMKTNGELLQFKDGWALAERYPAHIRASLSHGGSSMRKTAKKKGKKTQKTAKTAKPTSDNPAPEPLEQKIESYARTHVGELIGFKDVLSAIPGASTQAVSLTLGRLAKKRGWQRTEDGKYRVGV